MAMARRSALPRSLGDGLRGSSKAKSRNTVSLMSVSIVPAGSSGGRVPSGCECGQSPGWSAAATIRSQAVLMCNRQGGAPRCTAPACSWTSSASDVPWAGDTPSAFPRHDPRPIPPACQTLSHRPNGSPSPHRSPTRWSRLNRQAEVYFCFLVKGRSSL